MEELRAAAVEEIALEARRGEASCAEFICNHSAPAVVLLLHYCCCCQRGHILLFPCRMLPLHPRLFTSKALGAFGGPFAAGWRVCAVTCAEAAPMATAAQ